MGSAASEEPVDYLSRSPEDAFQKCWFGRDELIINSSTITPVTASAVMTDPEAPPPTNCVLQSASAPKEGMVSNEPSAASLPPPPVLPSGPREFDQGPYLEISSSQLEESIMSVLRRLTAIKNIAPGSVGVISLQELEHYLLLKKSFESFISQALTELQTGNVQIASVPEHAYRGQYVGAPPVFYRFSEGKQPLWLLHDALQCNHPATSAHRQAPTGVDQIAGMYGPSPGATTGYGFPAMQCNHPATSAHHQVPTGVEDRIAGMYGPSPGATTGYGVPAMQCNHPATSAHHQPPTGVEDRIAGMYGPSPGATTGYGVPALQCNHPATRAHRQAPTGVEDRIAGMYGPSPGATTGYGFPALRCNHPATSAHHQPPTGVEDRIAGMYGPSPGATTGYGVPALQCNHPATSAHLQAPTGVEDRIAGMYGPSPGATTGYGFPATQCNHPATSAHHQVPTGVEDQIAAMYGSSPGATTGYGVNRSPQFVLDDPFVSIGGFSGNASGHEYIGVQQGMQAQLAGGMQANSYYNMVRQGQHGTYPHVRTHLGAYANLYRAGEAGQASTTQQLLPLP